MSAEWKPTNNPKDALGSVKAPVHLVPQSLLVAASMAFLEGREKYGQYNWRVTGVRANIYYSALMRHMMAWWDGEDIDPDSGLPHLWKAAACIAILIDASELDVLEDDRPPQAPTAEMMARTKALGEGIRERLADFDPYQYTQANREDGPQEDPGPKQVVSGFAEHAKGEFSPIGPVDVYPDKYPVAAFLVAGRPGAYTVAGQLREGEAMPDVLTVPGIGRLVYSDHVRGGEDYEYRGADGMLHPVRVVPASQYRQGLF